MLTIINEELWLTIFNEGLSFTIVNEGLSLTIVNKTTNFIKNGRDANLLNVVLHEVKELSLIFQGY